MGTHRCSLQKGYKTCAGAPHCEGSCKPAREARHDCTAHGCTWQTARNSKTPFGSKRRYQYPSCRENCPTVGYTERHSESLFNLDSIVTMRESATVELGAELRKQLYLE